MSGSTHVLCCLNDLRSTKSVSCWLFHAVLAAVTRGQRDLLESSGCLVLWVLCWAQGSVGSKPHVRSSLVPEKMEGQFLAMPLISVSPWEKDVCAAIPL